MIQYTEKGAGLHDRIAKSGHWLKQLDGEWVSSDDAAVQAVIDAYTVADAAAYRSAEVERIAKAKRDQVIAGVSPGEMASWPIKLSEAATYAQSGNASDAPLLSLEAQARGVTLAELVGKVDGAAQTFAALEAMIAGTSGRHRDALAAATTFEEVAAYDIAADWPL